MYFSYHLFFILNLNMLCLLFSFCDTLLAFVWLKSAFRFLLFEFYVSWISLKSLHWVFALAKKNFTPIKLILTYLGLISHSTALVVMADNFRLKTTIIKQLVSLFNPCLILSLLIFLVL